MILGIIFGISSIAYGLYFLKTGIQPSPYVEAFFHHGRGGVSGRQAGYALIFTGSWIIFLCYHDDKKQQESLHQGGE